MNRNLQFPSKDGTRLAGHHWEPAGQRKGQLLIVHGVGEHIGRYEKHAEALTQRGWQVFGVDLRGHGASSGKRGHVKRWTNYLEDLNAIAHFMKPEFVVLAHSMGGLVAMDWLRHRDDVSGLVLSSPLAGFIVEAPAWKLRLAEILSIIAPSFTMDNELDSADLCTEPNVVKTYEEDPLVSSLISARWFTEMKLALERVHHANPQPKLPIYLNLAGNDKLIPNEDARRLTLHWNKDAVIREWPGLSHETLNEPCQQEVLGAIADWAEKVSPGF